MYYTRNSYIRQVQRSLGFISVFSKVVVQKRRRGRCYVLHVKVSNFKRASEKVTPRNRRRHMVSSTLNWEDVRREEER
jgi:DNA primase